MNASSLPAAPVDKIVLEKRGRVKAHSPGKGRNAG